MGSQFCGDSVEVTRLELVVVVVMVVVAAASVVADVLVLLVAGDPRVVLATADVVAEEATLKTKQERNCSGGDEHFP